jgi:hypothetical protein
VPEFAAKALPFARICNAADEASGALNPLTYFVPLPKYAAAIALSIFGCVLLSTPIYRAVMWGFSNPEELNLPRAKARERFSLSLLKWLEAGRDVT